MAFETLVVEAMEVPKVKRSSVGSISSESIVSNLSMHPAVKKLSMNDFMNDSAVKFYLNGRTDGVDDSEDGDEGDDTLVADTSYGGESDLPRPQCSSAAAAVEGADEVLDLREGDAVVYESDDCEGCVSLHGTDWTADVEEEEEEVQTMTRVVWMCGIEYYKGGDVRSRRKIKRRWIRS